jgi:ADP-dependent NAD(P)H-hydrate dehydratase
MKPTRITRALLRRWPLPELDGVHGKEDRGRVLVIGGSDEVPGAAVLAAVAALRAGAGTLQIATTRRMAPHVAVTVPEARVIGLATARSGEIAGTAATAIRSEIGRADAILIGPGMCDAAVVRAVLAIHRRSAAKATLVLDAGALQALPGARKVVGKVIVTPHAGEMAKLCGLHRDEVVARPHELARETAARLGVVVALKGARTYVAAPDGTSFENTAGNLGLGTSGSGDTLSGVIAGLCARGADPLQAAVYGVHLHARAGEVLARKVGPLGFLARELLLEIPPLLARCGKRL